MIAYRIFFEKIHLKLSKSINISIQIQNYNYLLYTILLSYFTKDNFQEIRTRNIAAILLLYQDSLLN